MREIELLIGGIIVGLMIAMPVGPVNILCIHRTIEAGWRSGVISGVGAAAADMLYGGIAGFSITLVVQFLVREQFWIRFFGGILLVAIGIWYFFKRPAPLDAHMQDRGSAYSDMQVDISVDPHESDDGAVVSRPAGGARHGGSKAVVVDRVSGRRDLLRFDGVVDRAEQSS